VVLDHSKTQLASAKTAPKAAKDVKWAITTKKSVLNAT